MSLFSTHRASLFFTTHVSPFHTPQVFLFHIATVSLFHTSRIQSFPHPVSLLPFHITYLLFLLHYYLDLTSPPPCPLQTHTPCVSFPSHIKYLPYLIHYLLTTLTTSPTDSHTMCLFSFTYHVPSLSLTLPVYPPRLTHHVFHFSQTSPATGSSLRAVSLFAVSE